MVLTHLDKDKSKSYSTNWTLDSHNALAFDFTSQTLLYFIVALDEVFVRWKP